MVSAAERACASKKPHVNTFHRRDCPIVATGSSPNVSSSDFLSVGTCAAHDAIIISVHSARVPRGETVEDEEDVGRGGGRIDDEFENEADVVDERPVFDFAVDMFDTVFTTGVTFVISSSPDILHDGAAVRRFCFAALNS